MKWQPVARYFSVKSTDFFTVLLDLRSRVDGWSDARDDERGGIAWKLEVSPVLWNHNLTRSTSYEF